MITTRRRLLSVCVFILLVCLAGCSSPAATAITPEATPAGPVATLPPTAEPSPTPGKPVVALVGQPAEVAALTVVPELAGGSGLTVETYTEVNAGDVRPEWKVIILAAPPANLDQVLAAAGSAQVVLISPVSLSREAPNLSVITADPASVAFLSGYLAELLTSRISPVGLLPADSPNFAALQDAFLNGGQYWCGQCRLVPNFEQIGPLVAAQPVGADAATWQAGIVQVAKNGLDIVYLPAESATPALISVLAGQNVRVIGNQAPPPELDAQWVATVQMDANESLRALWPAVTAGKGGQRLQAAVRLSDVRSANLPDSRVRLFEETAEKLEQGLLAPLSVP